MCNLAVFPMVSVIGKCFEWNICTMDNLVFYRFVQRCICKYLKETYRKRKPLKLEGQYKLKEKKCHTLSFVYVLFC